MAVDEINPILSTVPTVLPGQTRATSPRQLNEILRPVPAAIIANQELTPAQRAALLVNETLQDLNVVPLSPTDALLIDETNPEVTELLETIELTPAQQAAVLVNETLQDLTTPLPQAESVITAAVAAGTAAQALTSRPAETAPTPGPTAASEATGVTTPGVTLAAAAAAPPPVSPSSKEIADALAEMNLSRTVPPPIVDRNIIATPVYEIRDPSPAPAEPKPINKEIPPPHPFGRVRRVDPLVLRQEWEKRREKSGRKEEGLPRPPLAEVAISQMVSQANEDLAVSGLPLRLVLAKNNEGYSLDIYDCSDNELCRLSQEVHLDLSQLLTILDNIQHETGLIVNIMT